jgi:hypothetical protein
MGSRPAGGRRRTLLLKIGFVGALVITALSVVAISWADNVNTDGDGVLPFADNNMAFGDVDCGVGVSKTALVKVRRNGASGSTNVFDDNSTVSVSVFTVAGTGLSATVPSAPSNQISLPSNWGALANNTLSAGTVSATVTVNSSTAGPGSGSVTFRGSGVNASNDTIDRDDAMSVTWNIVNCAPPDTNAPTISCTVPNQATWYSSDVTVDCTASDPGSGLASAADASFSLTTSVAGGTETSGASTGSRNVCDNAGNCATAGPYTFKVDKKAPALSGCDSADGNWHAGDVTLHCTYTDGGSGPASQQVSLSTNVAAGTEDANASASAGGTQACDAVNNCATSPADIAGNKVDKKAPSVSCGAADGLWHAADVSIACTGSDGGSGLANAVDASFSLTTNVPAGTEDANASTNSHAVADAVGNSATAGPIAGNKVDKKAPAITCSLPAPLFYLNQAPANVTGVAADAGSGPASQALSAPANTSSVLGNPKSVTLSASDTVGNSSSQQCAYSVVFNFHGFFQPVDNLPTMNRVNAGSAVPVKFDLSGDQGLDIFAVGYPKTKLISCSDSGALDDIESTVTAGGSSLSYGNGQYVYVWKTEKSWAGQCRELDVLLADGTMHSAKFRFK